MTWSGELCRGKSKSRFRPAAGAGERLLRARASAAGAWLVAAAGAFFAHCRRAPLSAIHGFRDCLQRPAWPGERGRHYLQRILTGVHHRRELTGGPLSLASLAQASLPVKS